MGTQEMCLHAYATGNSREAPLVKPASTLQPMTDKAECKDMKPSETIADCNAWCKSMNCYAGGFQPGTKTCCCGPKMSPTKAVNNEYNQ